MGEQGRELCIDVREDSAPKDSDSATIDQPRKPPGQLEVCRGVSVLGNGNAVVVEGKFIIKSLSFPEPPGMNESGILQCGLC